MRSTLLWVPGVGSVLGLGAWLADHFGGAAAIVLLGLFSTMAMWGATAFAFGATASRMGGAIRRGIGVLVVAWTVYYGLLGFVTRRWHVAGISPETGEFQWPGSLARFLSLAGGWLLVCVVAGVVLGVLGWRVRVGRGRTVAVPAAMLLMCADLAALTIASGGVSWSQFAAHEPGRQWIASTALGTVSAAAIVLAVAVVARRRQMRAVPSAVPSTAVSELDRDTETG